MYQKYTKSWIKHLDFIVLDILSLQIAFVIAYIIRNGYTSPYQSPIYREMAFLILLIDFVVIIIQETFTDVLKRGYYKEFAITIKHACLIELLSVLYLFTMKESENYSRVVLYITGGIYAVLSYLIRIGWKQMLEKRVEQSVVSPILIITDEQYAPSVIENVRRDTYKMLRIKGVVLADSDKSGHIIAGVSVVASVDTAAEYVCREWIDEVLVVISPEVTYPKELVEKLMETGIVVHQTIPEITGTYNRKQIVERISDYQVITSSINYMTTKQLMLKRAFDILGGLVGCVLTCLIAIVFGPIIYIKSPGPIFFSQIRVGKNGKKFKIYKFRSMYMDAEKRKAELMKDNRVQDSMMFKLDFDPRVIGNEILPNGEKKCGIGDFLRRTSLDEFPQFFNVLKGDMSIVGTRPPTLDEWEKYKLHHRARLSIKPGITGMWQVSGRSDITDFEKVVKLDMDYITQWSMGLDCRIILQTLRVLVKKEGAL